MSDEPKKAPKIGKGGKLFNKDGKEVTSFLEMLGPVPTNTYINSCSHWPMNKPITAKSMREAFGKLAEQLTRDVHSDVCMTEATLAKVMANRFGVDAANVLQMKPELISGGPYLPEQSPSKPADEPIFRAVQMLFGMRLHVSKTEVGAQFRALLLASVTFDGRPGKVVLLVKESGKANTVRWN